MCVREEDKKKGKRDIVKGSLSRETMVWETVTRETVTRDHCS